MLDRIPLFTTASGLADNLAFKVALALVGGVVLEALDWIAGAYGKMLVTDPFLVFILINLVLVDLGTGIWAARRRAEKVSSKGVRQTFSKAIQYSVLLFVFVSLSNAGAGEPFGFLLAPWDEACLIVLLLTEGFSIVENVRGGKEQARLFIKQITDLASRQTRTVMEVVQPVPLPKESAPVAENVGAENPAEGLDTDRTVQ